MASQAKNIDCAAAAAILDTAAAGPVNGRLLRPRRFRAGRQGP
jgi:hypothetical protein